MRNVFSFCSLIVVLFGCFLPGLHAEAYEVKNLTKLTNGPIQEAESVFNTGGTKIVYRYLHPPYSWANCDIWVMNIDGSGKTQITTDSRGEFNPRFAPDGQITYTKEFGSNDYDLWIVNADGSSPQELIGGSYRQQNCRWHPNGNKIVYESEYKWAGPTEIWTANPDGTGKTKLTDHAADGYGQNSPVYSRSGNLIAYANYATSSANEKIWVMNSDGSGKRQVTFGSEGHNPRFWWPDDSMIGYIQGGDLWLHNLSTGTDELLPVISGDIGFCDLSPDGTKLVFEAPDGHIWIGDVTSEPPVPELVAIWSGPGPGSEALDVTMGEKYRINVSLFAETSWPGGTVRLRLEETAYYWSDDKWNQGNEDDLNDTALWKCYMYPSPFGDGAPVLIDEDYDIGSEDIELYLPPGGGVLPVANLYFEGSHKWAWIRPWSMLRIVDSVLSTALDELVPGISLFLSLGAYQSMIDESVLSVDYYYEGFCDDRQNPYFGGVAHVHVPEWKKFALAESTGFAITASPFSTLALGIIRYGGGEIQLGNPIVVKALASQALLLGGSQLWYILAADPPDMDYETMAVPVPLSTLGALKAPRAAELEATIRALKESLEKWEGARISGAVEWQAIQLAAARYFAQTARDILYDLATFWEDAISDLPAPTPEQIQLARNWVEENGLPTIETDILYALGYTSDDIEELTQMIISIDDTYFEQTYKLPALLKMCAEGLQQFESALPDFPQDVDVATVNLGPSVLNMKSAGKWVTLYIEPPEGHDVSEIDFSSLKLQNSIDVEGQPTESGDYDNDGIPDLMVKFDRQELIEILGPGDQIVTLTGQLSDGSPLNGIDTIRVLTSKDNKGNKGSKKAASGFNMAGTEENLEQTDDDAASEAFNPEEAIVFMLFEAGTIIDKLGPESCKNKKSGFELACAIDDVFTMLDAGMYSEALAVLETDILDRTDGCANIGKPDKNDWITSFEGQALVYPLVLETIELLESLM